MLRLQAKIVEQAEQLSGEQIELLAVFSNPTTMMVSSSHVERIEPLKAPWAIGRRMRHVSRAPPFRHTLAVTPLARPPRLCDASETPLTPPRLSTAHPWQVGQELKSLFRLVPPVHVHIEPADSTPPHARLVQVASRNFARSIPV